MRKPFYKPKRRRWYVEIDNKQLTLSEPCDKEDQDAKDAAFQKYHQLMIGRQPRRAESLTVQELIAKFLTWNKANREDGTHEWYYKHLVKPGDFGGFTGARMLVNDLTPFQVQKWLDTKYKGTSASYRCGACRALARCFNWAVKMRLIPSSPISGMERPQAQPRDVYIQPAQWAKLAALVNADDPFHDIMWFLRWTGCRPKEARIVTAAHWDRKNNTLTLERNNSKGKKARRVIWLNDQAAEIVKRLAVKRPSGPLFLQQCGSPWDRFRLGESFAKLAKKAEIPVTAYVLRHTWITDALTRGVDPVTVAKMAGHADLAMIMRVYGHIEARPDFMAAQVKKATGEVA